MGLWGWWGVGAAPALQALIVQCVGRPSTQVQLHSPQPRAQACLPSRITPLLHCFHRDNCTAGKPLFGGSSVDRSHLGITNVEQMSACRGLFPLQEHHESSRTEFWYRIVIRPPRQVLSQSHCPCQETEYILPRRHCSSTSK